MIHRPCCETFNGGKIEKKHDIAPQKVCGLFCVWVLEREFLFRFFNVFFGPVSTTFRAPFSPIILQKRQKTLRPISPKLGNSHLNSPDWYILINVREIICICNFGVNCPFKVRQWVIDGCLHITCVITLTARGGRQNFCIIKRCIKATTKDETRLLLPTEQNQQNNGSTMWAF